MAQDSIAYGESLLADIRERNAKETRRREKEAKKDAWKALGMKVAIGVGESIAQKRQQDFLNNEDMMANKLQFSNATTMANETTEIDKLARNFAGGSDMYFKGLAAPAVDDYLSTQFKPGSYNQNEYDLYKAQLTDQWGAKLKEKHEKKMDVTKSFLSTTGGDKDAYITAVKAENPGTIKGMLRNLIGEGTGLLSTDLANSSKSMITSAEAVNNFEQAYAQTGDAGLATFIANNDVLQRTDLGKRAPVYGDIVSDEGPFGETRLRMSVTTTDEDGNSDISVIYADPRTGKFNFNTSAAARVEQDFDILTAQVKTATDKTFYSAGQSALQSLDADRLETLQDAIKEKVEESHKMSGKVGPAMVEEINDTLSAQAGAIIYTASRKEGWATAGQAKTIAQYMMLEDAENPGTRVMSGVGFSNPYHTMFSMNKAIKDGRLTNVGTAFTDIGTADTTALYNAYRTETKPGREAIDAQMEANDFFAAVDGQGGEIKKFYSTVKYMVENGIANTDSNFEAVYGELYNPLNKKQSTPTAGTPTKTEVAPLDFNPTGRLALPSDVDVTAKEKKNVTAQYKNLTRLQKEYTIEAAKPPVQRDDLPQTSLNIINERQARKVAKLKANLNKKVSAYIKKYGERATPEMLADFTEEEKENYYNKGIMPDAFLPAV